ncbi:MAG: flavodoxin domain-containing protein [Alphaproteobacteria bacterium]
MKILILYATTEGQTRKIAEFVADQLKGDDVALADAANLRGAHPDPETFDAAILAASIHAGHYQSSLVHFARENHARLNDMPALFLSVSLSAAGSDPDDLKGIAECAEKFKAATGWSKAEVLQIAGAFRFTKYDFFKSWVMRLIARQKKVKVNPNEDLEFTDWKALAGHIEAFRSRLGSRKMKKAG